MFDTRDEEQGAQGNPATATYHRRQSRQTKDVLDNLGHALRQRHAANLDGGGGVGISVLKDGKGRLERLLSLSVSHGDLERVAAEET